MVGVIGRELQTRDFLIQFDANTNTNTLTACMWSVVGVIGGGAEVWFSDTGLHATTQTVSPHTGHTGHHTGHTGHRPQRQCPRDTDLTQSEVDTTHTEFRTGQLCMSAEKARYQTAQITNYQKNKLSLQVLFLGDCHHCHQWNIKLVFRALPGNKVNPAESACQQTWFDNCPISRTITLSALEGNVSPPCVGVSFAFFFHPCKP